MTAPTVPELEELVVQSDDDDPRCEIVYDCPDHGPEDCGGRARWVVTIVCPKNSDHNDQALVCDACHDVIVSEGDQFGDGHTVTWRPL